MKLAILFCILGALLLQCQASPVQLVENHELVAKTRALGRQAAASDVAPAAASGDDDDDEDDDDDDADLGDLVDDDDDDDDEEDDTPQGQAAPASDDDEEEDDDEDDYLDRIFDDILEDDDDDDDDDDSSNTVQQAVQQPAAVAQSNPAPAPAAAVETVAAEIVDPLPAGQSADYPAEEIAPTTPKAVPAVAPVAASSSNDDDDDDDDEDDITGALEDDDDGDDDDAEDDDDDDIIGDGVIEARRARALKSSNGKQQTMKDALQARHNTFVDAIFERINKIVSESYDPFKVRLTGNRNLKKSKNEDTQRKSKKSATKLRSLSDPDTMQTTDTEMQKIGSDAESMEIEQMQKDVGQEKAYAASGDAVASKAPKKKTKQTDDEKNQNRRAEGTLYGMASLKRVGNVKMITDPEGKNSTIKSKFTLGPLTLKVEKSFKRGNVRSVKSATAKTNEMIGRIKFKVVNDSATLMSIKVQQPKQVEVESKDNHDRTRELVWKGTPQIAHFVSEKLKDATLSLFQPVGPEIVHL